MNLNPRAPVRFAKRLLYVAAGYISIVGLVTFSLFILEESIQMATFGTWPASDSRDWALVREGLRVIETANHTMKIINYSAGWIQPLAFLSYRAYARSTDYYIESMKAKIFAHDPRVMIGERVTVTISVAGGKVTQTEEGTLVQPRRNSIFVLFPHSVLSSSSPIPLSSSSPIPLSSSSPIPLSSSSLLPREASLPASLSIRVSGLVSIDAENRVLLQVDLIYPVDF